MPTGGNFVNCNCGPDSACESPTEPVATVGLCLPDGSPIAVTVVRDCIGQVSSEGWLDLTTGEWQAGAPPDGVTACTTPRSVAVSGTLCDLGEDGEVLGLVLVEYQHAPDGSLVGVRLVNATSGDTYTPQGAIGVCPAADAGGAAAGGRGLVPLCDVTEDGTATPFVRDFERGPSGAVTGYTDYDLDGSEYTPSGTVQPCAGGGRGGADESPDVVDCDDGRALLVRVCGTGEESPGAPDATSGVVELCDSAESGEVTRFWRHVAYDESGRPVDYVDTNADLERYTPAGTVGACEPCPCPSAFAVECWATAEGWVGYDNTSMVGGLPGACGTIEGPEDVEGNGDNFNCDAGPYTITSWIINGAEVVPEGAPVTFEGGPCGGDDGDMHANWAAALASLDPHADGWVPDFMDGCAWYVRADNVPGSVTYGLMVIEGDGTNVSGGRWVLGPAQSCTEERYSRVWRETPAGEITSEWLDADGVPTDPPGGVLLPCGTGCGASAGGAEGPAVGASVERLSGEGTVTVPAGAREVAVTVVAGEPTVTVGDGEPVSLPAGGPPVTWSAGGGAGLADALTIEVADGDDVVVTSTRT